MYECPYPHLFSPITLAGTTFRNRIFAAPTGVFYADPEHRPIDETMSFYERKAKGGAASVCVGDYMIDGTHGMHGAFCPRMDDPGIYPALNKQAMQISRHGAVPTIEIFHGGSAAAASYFEGNEIFGPNDEDIEGALGQPTTHVRAMTRDDMDLVIGKFVEAAALAKRSGYGMIMLHAGHGFLLHQFLSPTLNHRTDDYGGSHENRMRFPLEVVRAVRQAVGPSFPLELRISGSEVYEGGYGVDYGCQIARAFDGLVDLIHVSAGSHEDASVFTVTHPSMYLDDGVNVRYAAEIKKHVHESKVATVGALADPALMEQIIATGQADVVELGRGLICDPDIPTKARRADDEQITRCIRCLTCFSSLIGHGQIVCALNPDVGNEAERKFEPVAPVARSGVRAEAVTSGQGSDRSRTVLVAGGGIAGMQAALTAAQRGHRVVLCEAGDRLGGVLRCEDEVPFKRHLREYLDAQVRRVGQAGIEVRLGTPATAGLARQIEPDVLIAAVGSEPARPPIPGIERALTAIDVYRSPQKAGGRVLILGGGLVGLELAIYLAGLGRTVRVLEMMDQPGFGDNFLHGMATGIEVARLGIDLRLSTKVVSIEDTAVVATDAQGEQLFEADTVVCALGMVPRTAVVDELRFCAPEFYAIGDCLAPRTIYEANRLAHQIALDIGTV